MGSSSSSNKQTIEVPAPVSSQQETKIDNKILRDGHYVSDMYGPPDNFIQIKFDGTAMFQRRCKVEYGTVSKIV